MEFFDTLVSEEAKNLVMDVLESGHLSEGKFVQRFEQELEKIYGYRNCVTVNSGTSALHLALIVACVGQGDEVILPAQTFVATGLAIWYCGAFPIFADIDKQTGNISVSSVASKISKRTKAVIAVSWGGSPCELDELEELCRKKRLVLIQDNAQALGATYQGRPLTCWGDLSCFSFQAIKQLTTGDGGMLACTDKKDTDKARRLRWFGIDRENDLPDDTGERKYNLLEIGYKYHMNDLSAALGLGNLPEMIQCQLVRERIAGMYDDAFDYGVSRKAGSANWLYTILIEKRKDFMTMMKHKGIPVSVVHVGIDRNDIFGGLQDLPNQRYWDKHHVCLPIHSRMTDGDVEKVIRAVQGGW